MKENERWLLQWGPVNGGPFAKLSFMRYGSHACTSLLPALHTCCHCDTLAERSLCSPRDQFKPWQHRAKPGCHLFRGTPWKKTLFPSVRGPLWHFVSMCMCECEWVGKGEWERRLIKIWLQAGCVCVRQGSMVIMLISHFLSECWKNTFFFHQPGRLLPPMLPTFMLQQGWSEGQKSGNQVNYGRRLADKSERNGRESANSREREWDCVVFFNRLGECRRVTAAGRARPGHLFRWISCDALN